MCSIFVRFMWKYHFGSICNLIHIFCIFFLWVTPRRLPKRVCQLRLILLPSLIYAKKGNTCLSFISFFYHKIPNTISGRNIWALILQYIFLFDFGAIDCLLRLLHTYIYGRNSYSCSPKWTNIHIIESFNINNIPYNQWQNSNWCCKRALKLFICLS